MRALILIGLSALSLSGCAWQTFSIRSLPPETPAADNAAAIRSAAALAAPSAKVPVGIQNGAVVSAQGNSPAIKPGMPGQDTQTAPPLTPADAPSLRTYDPWERLNRFTYRFNARFDEAVFLPVSDGYRRLLPGPLRSGVHNFFSNLAEVKTTANYIVQLKLGPGGRSLGRFVINSTMGIGGLLDVATKLKLGSAPTGFSTTLSRWGVHQGPYLVIPLLGPSTLRDSVGLLGDYGVSYAINVGDLYRGNQSWALSVVDGVDQRSNVAFRYYSTGSPFEYETVRFLYMRKRLIEDEGLHKRRPAKRDSETPAGQ